MNLLNRVLEIILFSGLISPRSNIFHRTNVPLNVACLTFGSRATDLVLQIPQASGDEETMSCRYYSAAMVRKCSSRTAFYSLLSASLKLQQVGVFLKGYKTNNTNLLDS